MNGGIKSDPSNENTDQGTKREKLLSKLELYKELGVKMDLDDLQNFPFIQLEELVAEFDDKFPKVKKKNFQYILAKACALLIFVIWSKRHNPAE